MAINNIPFVPPPYRSTKGTSDQPPDHGTLRLRFEGTVWTGISFATLDHAGKKKRTKRDVFLAQMAAARQALCGPKVNTGFNFGRGLYQPARLRRIALPMLSY
jgi:hypothetical protein